MESFRSDTPPLIHITEAELLTNARAMAQYTMEEVLDILDDVEEVICDGSDDDLGMGSSSDSDASDVDEQMYSIRYIACIAMYRSDEDEQMYSIHTLHA